MPNAISVDELDPMMEEVDHALDVLTERAPNWPATPPDTQVGDLSNGGRVGDVRVIPYQGGKQQQTGRPTVINAWKHDGTPSTLPLAWNPEGTQHDAARRYRLKRHCDCCNYGGFTGRTCPMCIKNSCARCRASTDRNQRTLPNGQVVQGFIIPAYYLRKEDVPYQTHFYGNIDCFHRDCARRNGLGFQSEAEMVMHAQSRHRLEYAAYARVSEASKTSEVELLRTQVATLLRQQNRAPARRSTTTKNKS